jgi:predicted RNA binding protein YcfA (HicA-like mRNA interferase family)
MAYTGRFLLLRWRLPLGKLRVLSGRVVCKSLSQHGFSQVRQRGSHVVMRRKDGGTTITIPVPDYYGLEHYNPSSDNRDFNVHCLKFNEK